MGKSTSDSGTKTTTSYKTTTSTTIGDIGFTGKDAIAFETAILQYNLASQQQALSAVANAQTRMSDFQQVPQSGSPTESEGDQSDVKKPATPNYMPIILIAGAGIIGYLLFVR